MTAHPLQDIDANAPGYTPGLSHEAVEPECSPYLAAVLERMRHTALVRQQADRLAALIGTGLVLNVYDYLPPFGSPDRTRQLSCEAYRGGTAIHDAAQNVHEYDRAPGFSYMGSLAIGPDGVCAALDFEGGGI